MSTDAVALLQIPMAVLRERLRPSDEPGALLACDGVPMAVTEIDGGALVHTRFPLRDADADQIAVMLRDRLGAALDEHGDARGVLVFAEACKPKARDYAGVVEEIGELGEWAPVVDEEHAPGAGQLPGGLGELLGGMLKELGPDLGAIAGAMMGGDPEAMAEAMRRVQAAADKHGGAEKMLDALGGLGGIDLGAVQQRAEKLVEQNPDLARQIESELGKKKS